MNFKRSSGILLHPTSLPGRFGVGSLGKNAFRFIDYLAKAEQTIWQVLPMGHTGYGDSPYQCFSIYAGNPILIDFEILINEGLLSETLLHENETSEKNRVDYGKVINFKKLHLNSAYDNFAKYKISENQIYQQFLYKNKHWLTEYAIFIELKEYFNGLPWWDWPEEFKFRDNDAIQTFKDEHSYKIGFHEFCQFVFFTQWSEVKKYANHHGISIVGDIPLYVAHDSADVWSNHQVFQFDKNLKPLKVAGVPPDYFSSTGQLWGNPLYNWDFLQKHHFQWWVDRVKATFEMYDFVRIDHFRGFEAYWAVPFGDKTAENGEWVKAPGTELFTTITENLGELPIIAEDLGIITPEVEKLRDDFGFPGMKILQFAFHSDDGSGYLPHNYTHNFIVYTGTHDNDTLAGWYQNLEDNIKKRVLEYADANENNVVRKMIRVAWSSVADMAIIPLQDLLDLGSESRMNTPGTPSGNWQWRFSEEQLTDENAEWLAGITKIFNRQSSKNGQ
jgi:4-alpha-glucanotransferase